MRAYLLGQLNNADTVAFEEQYFTQPSFLSKVKNVEAGLIEDYLRNRLPESSRESFQRIYLEKPELLRKVEIARLHLRPERTNWRLALVTFAAAACLAVVGFFLGHKPSEPQLTAKLESAAVPLTIDVPLSPGLTKGIAPVRTAMIPAREAKVRLILEIPGVTGPIRCAARVLRIDADGTMQEVATTSKVSSSSGANTKAEFILDSFRFRSGDYLAEVIKVNGTVLEKYNFTVRQQ